MTTNDIERTFRFSGIYLPGCRRPASILITLYLIHDDKNRPVFAVRAGAREMRDAAVMALAWYTAKQRDETTGTMGPLRDDPLFAELYRLYSLYNRNDLHAGTPAQEEAIRQAIRDGELNDPARVEIVSYLKSLRLYVDETVRDAAGDAHRYGHGRIYAEIPKYALYRIRHLIETGNIHYEQNI